MLAFVFASVLALLPLIVATAAILASFVLLLALTYLGDFSYLLTFLIALVGLGVAIDYSLLLVTRWREERDRGLENHEAVVVVMQTAGRAVVISGMTVAIGLISLLVLPVPFMRGVGVGGALIPLTSAGHADPDPRPARWHRPRVDWPKIRHEHRGSRWWTRWTTAVVRFRSLTAAGSAAILLALVGAFFGIKVGLSSSDSLASSGPAHEALARLEEGGVNTGNLTPIEVLVSTDQAATAAAELTDVDGIERALVSSDPASNRDGQSVVVLVPDQGTVDSTSVGVERVRERAEGLTGVEGVTGIGAIQDDFVGAST